MNKLKILEILLLSLMLSLTACTKSSTVKLQASPIALPHQPIYDTSMFLTDHIKKRMMLMEKLDKALNEQR